MQSLNCQHATLVKQVVTFTVLPFLLNTGLCCLEILIQLGLGLDLNAKLFNPLSNFGQELKLISQVRHLLMATYQSYLLFMMTMFALTIVKMMIDYVKKSSPYQTKQSSSRLIQICKLTAYFTLSYCFCNLLLNGTMTEHKESPMIITRNLASQASEDQTSASDANLIRLSVTPLSTNKDFLSSIPIGSKMIVIANNREKIYTIFKEWRPSEAGLARVDISNPLLPLPPGDDLRVMRFYSPYHHASIASSPDNQKVVLVSCGTIRVLDAPSFSSLSSGKYADSKICDDTRLKLYQPSISISSDSQIAMISVGGLFIYNVSKLYQEKLLFADNTTFATSVVLLSMKKIALVGGYGLTIYDVSNSSLPKNLTTLHTDCLIASIAVSSDEKTAVIATFPLNSPSTLILRILDLTEVVSVSTKNSLEIQHSDEYCNIDSDFPPIVTITPNNDYIFWSCGKTYGNIYFATMQIKDTFLDSHPINSMAISKDGKLFLTTTDLQISIYKIGLSVEPSRSLIWKPQQALSTLSFSNVTRILPSNDGKTVYFCYQNTSTNSTILQIIDSTNSNRPRIRGSFKLPEDPVFMTLSASQKFLYIQSNSSQIIILNISNKSRPTFSQGFNFDFQMNHQFAVSPDDKRIYATNTIQDEEQYIITIDLSKKNAVPNYYQFTSEQPPVVPFVTISNDGNTLFYMRDYFFRFNVSNHRSPTMIGWMYPKNALSTAPIAFSPDGNFAFMLCMPKIPFLDIYNLSDIRGDVIRYKLPQTTTAESLNYFKQSETVYTKTSQGYLVINVSNTRIPAFVTFLKQDPSWKATAVTQNALFAASQNHLQIFSLEHQYALYVSTDNFQLGSASSLKLQMLKLNIWKKYDDIESNYKFVKFNLFKEKESVPWSEPPLYDVPLPNWMYFDNYKNEISLEPKLLSHVGFYHIFTVASLPIEKSAFSNCLDGDSEAQNLLMKELLDRDYIDEDLFITSKLYSAKALSLSSRFAGKESVIRDVLQNFIIELGIGISVTPSLFLRQNNESSAFLSIDTPSKQSITAEIELKSSPSKTEQAQFLKRQYSVQKTTLNALQTKLTLEGSLFSINEALRKLFIDLKGNQTLVEATITIQDGLNALVSTEIKNVTKFFKINQKPKQNNNHTIQGQTENFSFVSGQSFSINLNPETFYDVNDEALHYSLSGEPDWILLNGLSLVGTPPKTFLPSKISLTIIAQNEFKKESAKFTIIYTASFAIIIGQLAIYCGYLFSGYKFWLHLDKFWNILGKKFYQYPKEYQVEICQEVTDIMIPPIRFIAKEMKIALVILKELRKYSGQDKQLLSHFSESSDRIDKEKLVQSIQDMIKTLSYENKRRLYSYSRGTKDFQDLINELVANEIVLEKIQLPEEKLTSSVFNQMKSRWIEFVKYDCSQLGFSVNRNALEELCSSKSDESSSVPLINSSVNFDLLEIAIKTHAYKTHNLKKKQDDLKIHSKEKKVGYSLWYKVRKFFKLHLVDLKSESQDELGYGLKYSIENNELRFGGVVAANMFDTSVVVQLVNKKGLIMREIEIYGVENLSGRDKIAENQMELPL